MTPNNATPVTVTCQAILPVTLARIDFVTDLPAWYPDADEVKPAPMPLLRVHAFLNTRDVENQTDLLAEPGPARDWLVQAGLRSVEGTVSSAELDLAREIRDCLRSLLEAAGEDGELPADELGALRALAAEHTARVTVGDGGALGLECPAADTVGDGLFELLLIIREAQRDGSWSRLKMCANPDCQWVFYDRSRNQQGHWCDMAVCGNRLKNRQLRARRR
jgi:predicted RNA-binding Zn ribbon-like protein